MDAPKAQQDGDGERERPSKMSTGSMSVYVSVIHVPISIVPSPEKLPKHKESAESWRVSRGEFLLGDVCFQICTVWSLEARRTPGSVPWPWLKKPTGKRQGCESGWQLFWALPSHFFFHTSFTAGLLCKPCLSWMEFIEKCVRKRNLCAPNVEVAWSSCTALTIPLPFWQAST